MNKVIFTEQEKELIFVLIDLVKKNYNILVLDIGKKISEMIFVNTNLFDLDLSEEFIKKEIEAFLSFLENGEISIFLIRSRQLVKEDIDENIPFTIVKSIRHFCIKNSPKIDIITFNTLFDKYHDAYLLSFIKIQKESHIKNL